ncbi:MAG: CDP-diacylglycerol--serine O-phosphatidyltransferase [Candidatus Azobacteroides sp.]|nr:CDP-diacylglycerol--serine O-phosphatidyltransferase [Candidatus Azobacteroides sp.]
MKNLPNIITCLNLYSGCLACVMVLNSNYIGAFLFILLAAFFDFMDGFAARLLKAYSSIGAQLDSLADVVSFGMAPGFIVYSFLSASSVAIPYASNIQFLAFLIPVFAAFRLAKFNVDKRQTSSFLGLPVPANGLFWGALIPSFPLLGSSHIISAFFVVALIIIFCLLMVSELPMFSLKFNHYKWTGNEYPYIMILSTLLLTACFHLPGVCLSIVFYIFLSLIRYVLVVKKKI